MFVVVGPARTGTSLVMGLLEAFGFRVGRSSEMRRGPAAHHDYYELLRIQRDFLQGKMTAEQALEGIDAYKVPLPITSKCRELFDASTSPKLIVCDRDVDAQFRSRKAAVNKSTTMELVNSERSSVVGFVDRCDCPKLFVRFERWFDRGRDQLLQLADFVNRPLTSEVVAVVDQKKRKFK